jgi:hypothetical protein
MASSIDTTLLATGALGFTLALAWKDAISQTIRSLYPPKTAKAAARHTLIYAVVVTITIIVVVSIINHTRKIIHARSAAASEAAPGHVHFQSKGGRDETGIIRLWKPRAKEVAQEFCRQNHIEQPQYPPG